MKMVRQGLSWSGHERNCCFLNTGAARFANVSAASGLDFDDDGRALAVVDWDHDGDLDVWLSNRTGPRVRFLRNDTPTGNHFLALKLEGRTCNRDAIGARVEVGARSEERGASNEEEGASGGDGGSAGSEEESSLLAPRSSLLVRTLRAGEGFLGQSTKWLHFGLGQSDTVDRVVVRWPGGDVEEFTDLVADRHYRIVQSGGAAELWTPPRETPRLAAAQETTAPSAPAANGAVHSLVTWPLGLPGLEYETWDGDVVPLDSRSQDRLVLNLWASWCQPCLAELRDFTLHEQRLRAAGVQVVALAVDGITAEQPSDPEAAQQLLRRLEFPFASGIATADLVEKLQIVQNHIYDQHRALPVPTSILIDERGRMMALYRGPVAVDRLLADAALGELDQRARRPTDLPFPGRWLAPQSAPRLGMIADDLLTAGYLQESVNYLAENRRLIANDPQYAQMLVVAATALGRAGHDAASADHFRQALRVKPDHVTAQNNLAWVLATTRDPRVRDGEEALRWALQACEAYDFKSAATLSTLGAAYAATGDFAKAVETAKMGITEARSAGEEELLEEIEGHLRLYENGQPVVGR